MFKHRHMKGRVDHFISVLASRYLIHPKKCHHVTICRLEELIDAAAAELNISAGKITWRAVELQNLKELQVVRWEMQQETRFTPWSQKQPRIKMEWDCMFCACVRMAEAWETLSNSRPGGLGELLEYRCCITLGYLIQRHNPSHYQKISERILPILPIVKEESNCSIYYGWLQDKSALITHIFLEGVFERLWILSSWYVIADLVCSGDV